MHIFNSTIINRGENKRIPGYFDRQTKKEGREREEGREARDWVEGLGVIYPWGPVGGCFVLGSAVQDWSDVWQLTDDEAAFQSPFYPPFTPPTCWFSPGFGFWRVYYPPWGKFEPGITGLLAEIGTYVMYPELFFTCPLSPLPPRFLRPDQKSLDSVLVVAQLFHSSFYLKF